MNPPLQQNYLKNNSELTKLYQVNFIVQRARVSLNLNVFKCYFYNSFRNYD